MEASCDAQLGEGRDAPEAGIDHAALDIQGLDSPAIRGGREAQAVLGAGSAGVQAEPATQEVGELVRLCAHRSRHVDEELHEAESPPRPV